MGSATPSTSELRDAWDAVADGFDRHITPKNLGVGAQLLAPLDLGPGVRVIDVAAGSGALSIPAARAGADVLAVDISPAMIGHLRERARTERLTTLEARVGDGEDLAVGDAAFDVGVSMNGVSLFPDLARGLRELARVVRPGGTVLIVTFGRLENAELITFPLRAMQAVVPGPTGLPDTPPPFRLADPDVFRRVLAQAGLEDVEIDTSTWEVAFESAAELVATLSSSNPIGARLTDGLDDAQRAQALEVLDGMLRERSGGTPGAVLRTQLQVGRATVPSPS